MNRQTYKAQRRTIHIGNIPLKVAMLPNGDYVFSQSEVTQVVDKLEIYLRRFLQSKWLKALPSISSKFGSLPIEGSRKPIAPVSSIAALYWHKCAVEGNKKAQALIITIVKCSVYKLADEVFGIERGQEKRDRTLAENFPDAGVARIEVLHSELKQQAPSLQPKTQIERELKLKIQLAELELEHEKLRQKHLGIALSTREIKQIGIVSWEALDCIQKTLEFPTEAAIIEQIGKLGHGLNIAHWLHIRLTDCFWVLPWKAFYSLSEAVK